MTAGSGILHQEMPQASDRILGLQLWINLPRKDKMVEPKYRDITVDMVPKVEEEAGTVLWWPGGIRMWKAQPRATMWMCVFWI